MSDFKDSSGTGDQVIDPAPSKLSRGEFLKVSSALAGASLISASPFRNSIARASGEFSKGEIGFLEGGPDEYACLGAVENAVKFFNKEPYEWDSAKNHCSGFVGVYLEQLGFPTIRHAGSASSYEPKATEPVPEATTVKQAPWMKEFSDKNGKDLCAEISVHEMLTNKDIWKEIPAGTVLYLPEKGDSHHGRDQFTHTAVYMGLDRDSEPMFAEFSGYMKNGPSYGHGIKEFKRMYGAYKISEIKEWENNPKLNVFMFDAVEASRRIGLEGGPIAPSKDLLRIGFTHFITVNTNDGTLSSYKMTKDADIELVPIGAKDKVFTVIGRKLKKNSKLPFLFNLMRDSIPGHENAFYDVGSIVNCGIKRTTYTPNGIFLFEGTQMIPNFGNLGPRSVTDICLLRKVLVDKNGQYTVSKNYSDYTLHEVPRGTNNQEVLLREPQIKVANSIGKPVSKPNLTSGCVNMDADGWRELKKVLKQFSEDESIKGTKRIAVIFSTPNVKQTNLILSGDPEGSLLGLDPVGGMSHVWGYDDAHDSGEFYTRTRKYPLFRN